MRLNVAILLFALSLSPALAQECDPADDTQQGMNICAGEAEQKADDALNATYRKLMDRMAGTPDSQKLLKVSQRAWVAFRDAECDFTTDSVKQGSIFPLVSSQCLTRLTQERTKQLAGYLTCKEGDLACVVPAE